MGLMDEAAPTRRWSEGAGTGREWVRRAGHQRALPIATERLLESRADRRRSQGGSDGV